MGIKTEILTGSNSGQLKTEIMFFVASARSRGAELFRIKIKPLFDEDREARRQDSVARILRTLKQRGVIQLFVHSSKFDSSSTEIEYLKNKYPNITKIENDGFFFLVKP